MQNNNRQYMKPVSKDTRLFVRIDSDTKKYIEEYCKAKGVTVSDFTRNELASLAKRRATSLKGAMTHSDTRKKNVR